MGKSFKAFSFSEISVCKSLSLSDSIGLDGISAAVSQKTTKIHSECKENACLDENHTGCFFHPTLGLKDLFHLLRCFVTFIIYFIFFTCTEAFIVFAK